MAIGPSTTTRPRFAPVRHFALCLALGLLATVLVSWAIAARSVYFGRDGSAYASRARTAAEGDAHGEVLATRHARFGSVLLETNARYRQSQRADSAATPEELIDSWAHPLVLPWATGNAPWPAPGVSEGHVVRATGWPFVALWHRYHWRSPESGGGSFGEFRTPGGIRIEPSRGHPGAWPVDYPRALPLSPIWRGLIGNAFVYGVVAWLLLFAFRDLRAARRLFSGRCEHCGYSRQGLPRGGACPECGWPSEPPGAA